ncbi:immunoglobulin domain protein [Necator americanus]|uniref:Immunoglobulin domain protein n=1 Tax=Necator americanus TaxID=51031 RepID=W2TBE2_NECAM|nr:immunoglobulin domain protein [Necator americanus]ETN78516.1 immunoglobulin domain protein [Necator americanus]
MLFSSHFQLVLLAPAVIASARPVAVADNDHFTVKDNNEFHLEAERRYVQRGDATNITCPVFGYPTPGIKWTKDGNPLELSDKISLEGVALLISEADYHHAGLYTCEAVNEYTAAGKTSKPLIVIDRMLDVKSTFGFQKLLQKTWFFS